MPHTPGPWLEFNANGSRILSSWRVRRDHPSAKSTICTLNNTLPATEELANARLIAAAPELLEACRLLMRAEPMQQGERNGAIMGRISTAIDAARAALEKATGKSK